MTPSTITRNEITKSAEVSQLSEFDWLDRGRGEKNNYIWSKKEMRKSLCALRYVGSAMDTNSVVKTFFEAVKSNDIPKVDELLKTKVVDVNLRDTEMKDRTALHIAAAKGYYDLVRNLVGDYNADVNVKDAVGKIPLQLACDTYKIKIVKYLLEKKSDGRPYAERFLNEKIVDELFAAAAANDIARVVQLLKEKKVDVDAEDKGDNNRTILEIAARNGYEELIRILIDEFGADMTHKDDLGDSAKHMADGKYPNITKFLIEKGWEDSTDESEGELSDNVEMPAEKTVKV